MTEWYHLFYAGLVYFMIGLFTLGMLYCIGYNLWYSKGEAKSEKMSMVLSYLITLICLDGFMYYVLL